MDAYIHYGSDHFDISKFGPIKNDIRPWVKPQFQSGLWASPLDSLNGWYAWCKENDFEEARLSQSFIFSLKPNSKILYISTKDDFKFIEENNLNDSRWSKWDAFRDDLFFIDFEKVLEYGYDAIYVTINSLTYYSLYGWDVDSLLVLNPDVIMEA